jgi:hypothetical protein
MEESEGFMRKTEGVREADFRLANRLTPQVVAFVSAESMAVRFPFSSILEFSLIRR